MSVDQNTSERAKGHFKIAWSVYDPLRLPPPLSHTEATAPQVW